MAHQMMNSLIILKYFNALFQLAVEIYIIGTKCADVTDMEKDPLLLPSFKGIILLMQDRSPLAVCFV